MPSQFLHRGWSKPTVSRCLLHGMSHKDERDIIFTFDWTHEHVTTVVTHFVSVEILLANSSQSMTPWKHSWEIFKQRELVLVLSRVANCSNKIVVMLVGYQLWIHLWQGQALTWMGSFCIREETRRSLVASFHLDDMVLIWISSMGQHG